MTMTRELGSQTSASGASSWSRVCGVASVSRMIRLGVGVDENIEAAAAMLPLVIRMLTLAMRRSWAHCSITRCTPCETQKA